MIQDRVRLLSYSMEDGSPSLLGEIEAYSSGVWSISFDDIAKCSFTVVDSDLFNEEVALNNVLWLGEDDAMIIETISREHSSDDSVSLKVEGRDLKSLFERRAMRKYTETGEDFATGWTFSGNFSAFLSLMSWQFFYEIGGVEACSFPHMSPPLAWAENTDIPDTLRFDTEITFSFEESTWWDAIKEVCTLMGFGFKVDFVPEEKTGYYLQPRFYMGSDLSYNVKIADTLSNVSESSYYTSISSYRNAIYVVGGEAEYTEDEYLIPQKTVTVEADGNTTTGYQRFETVLSDGSSQITDVDGDEIVISDSVFEQQLENAGKVSLTEDWAFNTTFDVELIQAGSFLVGRDYNVGDTVELVDSRLGVVARRQLLEITYNISTSISISATFGEGYPTLSKEIKRRRL